MSYAFDICGPLPNGITVLEASAGTGKTYTIAALAARYVAEGTPLHELLLVTFTRMATGELRDRVRERLVQTERDLSEVLAGAPTADLEDAVARLLATGTKEEIAVRRDRLVRALADFDAATIATTHQFCQEVLGGLGVAGDLERDAQLVEDVEDLIGEIVDDLYVRRFMKSEDPPLITRAEAKLIATDAIENPGAPIEPRDTSGSDLAAMRARLAAAARVEFEARKRARSIITYDDLLTRLRDALRRSGVEKLRSRYRVVLVDEFQDTDPIQWEILRGAFGGGGVTLVLIGDPKQAIYAFRGADIYSYLEAKEAATATETLDVNWRSDQGLIDAYDAMFGGAQLGDERIQYLHVRANDPDKRHDLLGAPLRMRVVDRTHPSITLTGKGYANLTSARLYVASDLAADIVRLLESGKAKPGDIAVLVRYNRAHALPVRDALDKAGVPVVINGAGSVFGTPAAREWLRLLEALERPSSVPRARAATMTSFLGWSAERVATADDEDWEDVHRRLHAWAALLRRRGLASLFETITLIERLPGRVLAEADGERKLTDLRHVGQLLHSAAAAERFGTAALAVWLRQRVQDADREGDEERSRRLESDAEAVQVLTIHRSKGLEFPVVYVPYLWEPTWVDDKPVPIVYHDPDAGFQRTIDVGLVGSAYSRHKRLYEAEQRGEDLRLAYVALTRAKHQAITWWAGTWNSRDSALSRLLLARDADGRVATRGPNPPTDDAAMEHFRALASAAPGCVSVERATLPDAVEPWSGPRPETARLAAARFDRELDRSWRRTSYSDITAAAHEARVASEPEETVITDEPDDDRSDELIIDETEVTATPATLHAVAPSLFDEAEELAEPDPVLPLAGIPGGTAFGTFVHSVFEAVDFAAPDLDLELTARVRETLARRPVDIGSQAAVVEGLRAAIETPLGPLVDGVRLRDIQRADRLDELGFELPLAGGDDPHAWLTPAAIGAVLREHLGSDDPLAGYADRLADPELRAAVRGYLTGSIDLVFRVEERFSIVDYKTNLLAPPGEALTPAHYAPTALRAEMEHAHYGLQALLYTAALHRYLRWRLPGYDPDVHLGGVLYLFVRGMTGATESGVFAWKPPAPLVVALSDLLEIGVLA
ncbi:exodeoxyribonuclease V beta subunit [Solirubrobacter pauli]|uniref:RecBCD enzyme subunit RecB n=1 Tax=Solirubrobacter pauli TaxID=166793 RepID=A0A660L5R2_9ACTN|nr:UvrD-helicase domain-containing protein [Solirubrobacter pauli]RKQ86920.1 exodeoxyribonuclease V beta subunit [Solirubrobacter pauli]